jgi:hypothetical protein
VDDRDAHAVEHREDQELHEHQSRRLFALAGLAFLIAIVVAVVLLFRSIPGTSSFVGYPTPVATNGWYRIAEGRSLGETWSVEFANPGPCVRVKIGSGLGKRSESCDFALTESAPFFFQGASHERGGEREVVLFGAVLPKVASIDIVADGEAVETVLSDPAPFLQLNMRFFAALIGVPDHLEVTIRDRAGTIIFHDEGDNPYRDA